MKYYIITTESLKHYIVNENMEITQYKYNFPNWEKPKFSGKWKVKGLAQVLPFGHMGAIQSLDKLVGENLRFKNGKSKYVLVDVDYGTTRVWGDRVLRVYCKDGWR